ncbi:MAG TPA: MMPL family transporter [Thermoanaerobaculia bacterium]|nr:MMPL family transporter [Thermoanaerobaculia bacterium]
MELSFLQRLALFARRRYRAVFIAFGVLLALSLVLILQLSFNTDMLSLLPQEDPAVRAYVETLQDFGSSTYLLVAIRIPQDTVVDPYETLADRLAERLGTLPDLKTVQHKVGDPQELLETFYPKALLFLDEGGRKKLEERLSDEGIRSHVSEMRRQISTPQGLAAKELLRIDPLGLADVFLSRLQSSRGSLKVDWTSGYYLSGDHSLLLILAEPVRPPQDIEFAEQLAAKVDRIVAEETGKWGEIAGPGLKTPEVVVGGPHLTALGDAGLIRRDMLWNLGTVVPSVLLFFWFTFRRPGTLIYAMFPLFTGLLLTFGFAKIAVGSLSSATSGVAALLVGLGIDFVIVSYGRYIEERQQGANLEEALVAMMGSNGRAVLIGAVTTTVTFWAFTFTEFTGLRQMGLLTGTGILFCVFSVFLLLPAMLAWSEDHHTRRQKQPTLFLHSFGSEGLMRLALHHPRPTILIGIVITLISLALAVDIEFDESMKTMRPKGNRGIDVAEEVGRKFGSGFDSMSIILTGSTPEEVIELSGKAAEGAQHLVQAGTLYGYSGVTSLIPPPTQQREALAWIERQRTGALDLDRIRSTFASAAAGEGLRPEGFAQGLDLLSQVVSLRQTVDHESFQATSQTRLLLERYLRHTDRGWKAAVYLYPPDNRWRREPPPDAVRLTESLGPQAALSGTNVVNQRVRALVVRDAWIACVVGTLLVMLLIWIDFRSFSRTLAAMAPLTVGLIWMAGWMVAADTPMNFINIFVTTMIIGIGVDYGVHILHRFKEVQDMSRERFEKGIVETGKAVVAASVSTIFGFGSMMFSSYPGLVSTGKVAILGAVATCLVAITLVPAVLSFRYDRRQREAAATDGFPAETPG